MDAMHGGLGSPCSVGVSDARARARVFAFSCASPNSPSAHNDAVEGFDAYGCGCSLDAAGARAYLELIPNRLEATRIHSGFTEPYHGHSEPQPLAAETLLRLIDWGGFANGDRLRPVIAPLVRLLRTTCQDDARPGPDTYDARSFSCGVLVRLAGAKYRLHEVILAEGGVSAVIEVLQHLKLPGSNAVPKLLLKSSMGCMNVLYAVAAAGGLASVQAAIRSAFPSPQDLVRLIGLLEEPILVPVRPQPRS